MYCKKCATKLEDGYVCCPNCGTFVDDALDNREKQAPVKQGYNIWSILGIILFFIPLAGWFFGGLGISKSSQYDGRGKTLGILAVILATVVFILNIYITIKYPELLGE